MAQAHLGLLYIDGQLRETLQPGVHGFWRFHHRVEVIHIDMRARLLELNGQEILTRDKVTLRLNLTAVWRYADPEHAFKALTDPAKHLYNEVQFALRAAVSKHTLSTLVNEKEDIDQALTKALIPRLAVRGIVVERAGIKDFVLPRDARLILFRVFEAEQNAQAKQIHRREETAATRSLLNTARILESSPIALRMKELETIETIVRHIDNVQVHTSGPFASLLKQNKLG